MSSTPTNASPTAYVAGNDLYFCYLSENANQIKVNAKRVCLERTQPTGDTLNNFITEKLLDVNHNGKPFVFTNYIVRNAREVREIYTYRLSVTRLNGTVETSETGANISNANRMPQYVSDGTNTLINKITGSGRGLWLKKFGTGEYVNWYYSTTGNGRAQAKTNLLIDTNISIPETRARVLASAIECFWKHELAQAASILTKFLKGDNNKDDVWAARLLSACFVYETWSEKSFEVFKRCPRSSIEDFEYALKTNNPSKSFYMYFLCCCPALGDEFDCNKGMLWRQFFYSQVLLKDAVPDIDALQSVYVFEHLTKDDQKVKLYARSSFFVENLDNIYTYLDQPKKYGTFSYSQFFANVAVVLPPPENIEYGVDSSNLMTYPQATRAVKDAPDAPVVKQSEADIILEEINNKTGESYTMENLNNACRGGKGREEKIHEALKQACFNIDIKTIGWAKLLEAANKARDKDDKDTPYFYVANVLRAYFPSSEESEKTVRYMSGGDTATYSSKHLNETFKVGEKGGLFVVTIPDEAVTNRRSLADNFEPIAWFIYNLESEQSNSYSCFIDYTKDITDALGLMKVVSVFLRDAELTFEPGDDLKAMNKAFSLGFDENLNMKLTMENVKQFTTEQLIERMHIMRKTVNPGDRPSSNKRKSTDWDNNFLKHRPLCNAVIEKLEYKLQAKGDIFLVDGLETLPITSTPEGLDVFKNQITALENDLYKKTKGVETTIVFPETEENPRDGARNAYKVVKDETPVAYIAFSGEDKDFSHTNLFELLDQTNWGTLGIEDTEWNSYKDKLSSTTAVAIYSVASCVMGVGKLLIDMVEEWARENKRTFVVLDVNEENVLKRKALYNYYKQLGYVHFATYEEAPSKRNRKASTRVFDRLRKPNVADLEIESPTMYMYFCKKITKSPAPLAVFDDTMPELYDLDKLMNETKTKPEPSLPNRRATSGPTIDVFFKSAPDGTTEYSTDGPVVPGTYAAVTMDVLSVLDSILFAKPKEGVFKLYGEVENKVRRNYEIYHFSNDEDKKEILRKVCFYENDNKKTKINTVDTMYHDERRNVNGKNTKYYQNKGQGFCLMYSLAQARWGKDYDEEKFIALKALLATKSVDADEGFFEALFENKNGYFDASELYDYLEDFMGGNALYIFSEATSEATLYSWTGQETSAYVLNLSGVPGDGGASRHYEAAYWMDGETENTVFPFAPVAVGINCGAPKIRKAAATKYTIDVDRETLDHASKYVRSQACLDIIGQRAEFDVKQINEGYTLDKIKKFYNALNNCLNSEIKDTKNFREAAVQVKEALEKLADENNVSLEYLPETTEPKPRAKKVLRSSGSNFPSTERRRLATNAFMAEALINANLTDEQNDVVQTYLSDKETCKLVGYQFNIPLTIMELSCLKENELLNNEVVNFYLQMLSSIFTNSKAYVFITFLFDKIAKGDDFTRWLKNVPDTATTFFVPINIPDSHWYFAVIDTTTKTIKVYNSITTLAHSNEAETLQKLAQALKKQDYERPIGMDFVKQRDVCSCGVFMLVGIDCLWRGVQLPESVNANNLRKIIAFRIIKFGEASVDELEKKYYNNNESYDTQADCAASLLIEIEE